MPLAPSYQNTEFTPTVALKVAEPRVVLGGILASGYGALKPGHSVGLISATSKLAPHGRVIITVAEADTTAVTQTTVAQPQAFKVGGLVEIKNGGDDADKFTGLVISTVNYLTGVIVFTAALGAGAIDTDDYLQLTTPDGSESAVGIIMDEQFTQTPATDVMANEYQVHYAIHGFFVATSVPNRAVAHFSTDLQSAALGGGTLRIG